MEKGHEKPIMTFLSSEQKQVNKRFKVSDIYLFYSIEYNTGYALSKRTNDSRSEYKVNIQLMNNDFLQLKSY